MVCYGPKDFDPTPPIVLQNSDDFGAMSAELAERTATGLGSFRFGDCFIGFGGTSACEPEHLLPEKRWSWAGYVTNWTIRWTQARPWDPASSPYVYTPLFGEQFPATLGSPMAVANPKALETIIVPDAATAPVIEGLVLTIGSERCRVMAVNGDQVKLERGSESTTPAAHDPGQVMVSGRVKVNSVADWASDNTIVTELVSQDQHHLRTGQLPKFGEGPWPYFASTGGYQTNLTHVQTHVWVTGPKTIVVGYGATKAYAANETLKQAYTLDPTKTFTSMPLPEGPGIPYSVAARTAAKTGADLHVIIPFAASDSFVDAVAIALRDNYPAGKRVYIEYNNEPWNWGYITSGEQAKVCWLLARQYAGSMLWQVRRSGQIVKRVIARFDEKGRGAEVRWLLNTQLGSYNAHRGWVKQAMDEGSPPPDLAVAPYTMYYGNQPQLIKALNVADIPQAIDIWIYNLICGTTEGKSGPQPWLAKHRAAVDAINKEFGTKCELYAYECGIESTWPMVQTTLTAAVAATDTVFPVGNASLFSPGQAIKIGNEWATIQDIQGNSMTVTRAQYGTTAGAPAKGAVVRNAWIENQRDLVYHPLFRIAEFDQFNQWQQYFNRVNISVLALDWIDGQKLWGMYHYLGQPAARGDGRDGKFDHSTFLASPGANMKAPTDNQDLRRGSVRGQALLEWNRGVK
jgi:hypothetical protein